MIANVQIYSALACLAVKYHPGLDLVAFMKSAVRLNDDRAMRPRCAVQGMTSAHANTDRNCNVHFTRGCRI